jgi:hypothetical protein
MATLYEAMRKKREIRGPLDIRVSHCAKLVSPAIGPNAMLIHPDWKPRLMSALGGISPFFHGRSAGNAITRADSLDGRAFLEVIERGGALAEGDLQLAFPDADELTSLKLECWGLLFLRSLFADWTDAREWFLESTKAARQTGQPIAKWLNRHCVLCAYYQPSNVLDLRVFRY